MTQRSAKTKSAQLFSHLEKLSQKAQISNGCEDEPLDLKVVNHQPVHDVKDTSKTLRMKKFRAQLLYQWLVTTIEPCRMGDVGGGKGLLSYLLIKSGWDATVIDPFDQSLPDKYKDIAAGKRVIIPQDHSAPRFTGAFQVEMGAAYDLLVGMHAHGCNAMIIDAAQKYGCGFILFPCCVIDEPFFPRLGVHWLECLADYSAFKGQEIFPFRLNFKGQNIGLCHIGERNRQKKTDL